ncbi:MAG TPA: hypothetical protein VIU12_09230 [Chryseolinea sp.]
MTPQEVIDRCSEIEQKFESIARDPRVVKAKTESKNDILQGLIKEYRKSVPEFTTLMLIQQADQRIEAYSKLTTIERAVLMDSGVTITILIRDHKWDKPLIQAFIDHCKAERDALEAELPQHQKKVQ